MTAQIIDMGWIEAERARTSKWTPADTLTGEPPRREWLVPDLIPDRTVTLLGGDGGTGKSLLALQLACAVAMDELWIGQPVRAGYAVYLSAEDDMDELHRRLTDIAATHGVGTEALDRLTVRSVAGEDALLGALDRAGNAIRPTPFFEDLDSFMDDHTGVLRLLVIDTLADVFGGDENQRAHARQFIGLLRSLAIKHEIAVVLLAHPSKAAIQSGRGDSGSTAWNASVRSRLYLDRVKEESYEPDPDARILRTMKSNYGRTGGEIALRWCDGVFIAQGAGAGANTMILEAKAQRVFLALLDRLTAEGRYVSASPGPTYAPTQFTGQPDAEGCSKRALKAAMEQLFARGEIVVAEHGRGSKARSHIARKGEG